MRTRKLLSAFLLGLFFAMTLVPAQAAPKYKVTLLGPLAIREISQINDFGWMTGTRVDANNVPHPIIHFGSVYTDLGDLGGTNSNVAYGINHYGDAAGSVGISNGPGVAAIFSNGKVKVLGTLLSGPTPLGKGGSFAAGINNSMQVAGWSYANARRGATTLPVHAFRYDGSMHDLGTLGGTNSFAAGINNAGQILGDSDTAGNKARHAFIYANGVMTDLGGIPGFEWFESSGINNLGQATGTMYLGVSDPNGGIYLSPPHAFLYKNGAIKDIGSLPGGASAHAYGINDNGQIVGASQGAGFLYSNGVMMNLNDFFDHNLFPFTVEHADAINNAGQIVAYGWSDTNHHHWYVRLDPI
jgi:probable HAF family extracellular repeat protein